MKYLIDLIAKIVGEVLGSLLNKPIEEEENYREGGKKGPDNPDDVFDDGDW